MSRTVPEWIGATPDTATPPRVKLRIFEQQNGQCALCGVRLGAGKPPEYDHTVALTNGGENREGNLRALCRGCHAPKTRADVAEKAKVARVRKKHLGLHKPKRKMPYRRFDGTPVWPEESQ